MLLLVVLAHTVAAQGVRFLIHILFPKITPCGVKHHLLSRLEQNLQLFKDQLTALVACYSQLNQKRLPNS